LNFKKIIIYGEPAISEINIEELTNFVEDNFPVKVEIKDNILTHESEDILSSFFDSKR